MTLECPYTDLAAHGSESTNFEAILQTLEFYLADGIQRDREDILAIERALLETCDTITATFDAERKNWPYEIRVAESAKGVDSHSTATMMIRAIDLLGGLGQKGTSRPAYPFKINADDLEKLVLSRTNAFKALADSLRNDREQQEDRKVPIITRSGTYGRNDPLTLSFLAEVLLASDDAADLIDDARLIAKQLTDIDPTTSFSTFFNFGDEGSASKPVTNAFVPLLVVRAAQALRHQFGSAVSYLRYFESTLHDQLSYSGIPDSRFDPAELIFSLEGMLRLSDQAIDVRLFDRVLEVLEQAQQTSAHWRPSKPFLRTERGLVLFPISVEAANSLLWCCESLDDERFHGRSERYVLLFRRFWNWLAARRVSLPSATQRVSGWHSDHVADPDSIQLWDTAQVVGFLLGYRRSLHNHIARTTLRLSRFNVRKPKAGSQSWSIHTRDSQHSLGTVSSGLKKDEARLRETFEPVTSLGPYFETYRKIEEEFLVPWLEQNPRSYSMLLYGPPGTGKTTVAENLADALGFSLITITVSDFLAGGGGEVEARAKMMFDVLQAQANVVILFDEIDELVLDRSSKRHGQQDTVFKFMTPGMLTKLNDLRRAKRSIFIMATNYAYRIDPAIRRTGRIDENYLLLPPDSESRQRMIKQFLLSAVREKAIPKDHDLDPAQLDGQKWEALTKASFFLGYKDIEAAVSRVIHQKKDKGTRAELERELLGWGRTTTLRLYNGAFHETDDRDAIEREFFPLVEMATREGGLLHGNPALDISEMLKVDQKTNKAPFTSEEEMNDLALKFVKERSPDYDRE
ncbi:AAA family ATPase [Mesorhizobium sp. B3-1-9]|uniref:ATP-binding protein n=1 Tax=Mesorhizobium sp. B3-1-9 TaxID=2589892 RepID=UPI00112BD4E9|nr:ATP-binding protein [Mesorhizobium sp. B3-1-9]TPI41930.1 AAA family ATPase [Mesorhizobium sp. B3-1-9]